MSELPVSLETVIQAALDARARAYAPYSKYRVGAAVLTKAGEVICGVNVENASYPLCICAEQVALSSFIERGGGEIEAIVVATQDAGSPCGACRQVIAEFADPSCPVYAVSPDGRRIQWTVQELLPHAFNLS